jgi:hypothetical protein
MSWFKHTPAPKTPPRLTPHKSSMLPKRLLEQQTPPAKTEPERKPAK